MTHDYKQQWLIGNFQDVVKRKLNSRWKWQVWDVVPGTHAYQIYVFNITNPDEVEKGGKPTLQQLGPYYYK